MIKRTLFYLIGLVVACLGVALIIKSEVGAGPWDAFFVGAVDKIGLSVGIWVMIAQAFYLLFNSVLSKKRIQFESIMTILLWGVIIDFQNGVVLGGVDLTGSGLGIRWVVFFIGVALVGGGIGLYLTSKFPTMPYDGTMVLLSEKFRMKLNVSRTILEVAGALLALLVGGPIGIGTFIILLLIGPMIQVCVNYSTVLYERI